MGRAKQGKIKMLEKFQTTTYSLREGKIGNRGSIFILNKRWK